LQGKSPIVSQEEWEILAFPDANINDKKYANLKKGIEAKYGALEDLEKTVNFLSYFCLKVK